MPTPKALQEERSMLPAAAMRALRLVGCVVHVRARLRLGARAAGAEWSGDGAAGADRRGRAQLRPRGAVDHAEGQPAGLRHQRDAALARDRRPLLVRLPDPRRPALLPRRSGEEGEDAALRSREDGGRADDRSRAFPTTRRTCRSRTVRFVKKDTAFEFDFQVPRDRRHPLDQAARDDDRAGAAGGDQGR